MKPARRGISHSEAKELVVVTDERPPPAGLRAQPLGGRAHGGEHLRGGGVELLAGLGQRERAVAALEQRHAELVLELLDLAADRRLREVQLLARPW